MKFNITSIVIALVLTGNIAIAEEYMAVGKVKLIDQDSKTISIKHDRISSFSMAAMTMDFQMSDIATLDSINN